MWPTLDLPEGSVSGVKELARQLDEPHWLITQRCRRLGLTRPRKKEPPWSAAEDELMKRVPLHDPEKCSEIFKAHGFTRTATAIMVRTKRIGLSRRNTETFSATAAAKVIGLDNKTVAVYCLKGIDQEQPAEDQAAAPAGRRSAQHRASGSPAIRDRQP